MLNVAYATKGYTMTSPTVLLTLFLSMLVSAAAWAGPDRDIEAAVKAFAAAGDARSVSAAEGILHPEFRTVFAMGEQPEATLLSRATYLQLLRAGKIGGDERSVRVRETRTWGPIAVARVKLEGKKATFDGEITLARHEGRWKVVQDAVQMHGR